VFGSVYDYGSVSYGMDCGNCSDKFVFGTSEGSVYYLRLI